VKLTSLELSKKGVTIMATKKTSSKTNSKNVKPRAATGKKEPTKSGDPIILAKSGDPNLLTRSGDPIIIGGGAG
jgi:hypothetical protein